MTDSTLFKQLIKIQKELKAPKSQYNSFAKFNYRSCEDILEAVKPLLGNTTLTLSDELVHTEGSDRFYIKATATLSDGKEKISSSALAREAQDKKGMDDSQITGTASSYARKYALNGLFAIDDAKDADTMDNRKVDKSTQTSNPSPSNQSSGGMVASPAQVNLLKKLQGQGRVDKDMDIMKLSMMDAKKIIGEAIKKKPTQ